VAQPGGAFMKLRCKPEQPDLPKVQHEESGREEDHGAGSEDGGKPNEKNKEDQGERENQQTVGEGEQEDDGEPEVKKLTEMSVEYEPLGVNR